MSKPYFFLFVAFVLTLLLLIINVKKGSLPRAPESHLLNPEKVPTQTSFRSLLPCEFSFKRVPEYVFCAPDESEHVEVGVEGCACMHRGVSLVKWLGGILPRIRGTWQEAQGSCWLG